MIKIDVQPHRRGASRHRSRVRAAYHTDPEREMRKILALLPNFEIFCLRSACAESRRFEIAAIKEGQSEADWFICRTLLFWRGRKCTPERSCGNPRANVGQRLARQVSPRIAAGG